MRWLHWPDFWLPRDRDAAIEAIRDAWDRTGSQRVEVACAGGRGRTGTVLSCIAVLDGVPNRHAVAYVRSHYDPKAVETPWQRRFVASFPAPTATPARTASS
jgi:protein-tyrosine phosphatase